MLYPLKELLRKESDCLVIKTLKLRMLEELAIWSQFLEGENCPLNGTGFSSVLRLFSYTVQADDAGVGRTQLQSFNLVLMQLHDTLAM